MFDIVFFPVGKVCQRLTVSDMKEIAGLLETNDDNLQSNEVGIDGVGLIMQDQDNSTAPTNRLGYKGNMVFIGMHRKYKGKKIVSEIFTGLTEQQRSQVVVSMAMDTYNRVLNEWSESELD